jgi:tetratricopeptide (TPR) repeat protein
MKSKQFRGEPRVANSIRRVQRTLVAAMAACCLASPAYAQRVTPADPELDGRTVFELLLGEIALQRGQPEIAAEAYGDVVRRTKDPAALARAMQVAVLAKRLDLALEHGRAWVEADPNSATARHALVGVLAGIGRGDEMLPHLRFMLDKEVEARPRNILHLPRLFAAQPDRAAVLASFDDLLAPYLDIPEARFVLAGTARSAGQKQRALKEIDKALDLRPNWTDAALFESQVLSTESYDAAIAALTRFLDRNPSDDEVRTQRGRFLASEKKYSAARADLETVLARRPESLDTMFALAVVALQQKDTSTAESHLRKLSERDFSGRELAVYQLGVLAEERGDDTAADAYYQQVEKGEYYIPAQAHRAQLMGKQGRFSEARDFLRGVQQKTPDLSPQDKARLVVAEAYLLREAKQFEAAFDVLDKALQAQPNEPDLLYDQAMLADRLKKVEVLENNLARVIALRPDNAQAYNALGYSLAERNVRLDEARKLIGKALELAPEDPFILDSMGWVLFRLGHAGEALPRLENAYRQRPDPEIAAHLGEVLWALGRRDDARRLWHDARQKFPDNEVLSGVIERLAP